MNTQHTMTYWSLSLRPLCIHEQSVLKDTYYTTYTSIFFKDILCFNNCLHVHILYYVNTLVLSLTDANMHACTHTHTHTHTHCNISIGLQAHTLHHINTSYRTHTYYIIWLYPLTNRKQQKVYSKHDLKL
jgi:hypothetical protein